MRIYLAGKYEEHKQIEEYSLQLEAWGHAITFPWFRKRPEDISLADNAADDYKGVRDSDACVFIFEHDLLYKGAYTELGMAIALEKRIVVVGSAGDRCIFMNLPCIEKVSNFQRCLEVLDGR